MNPQQAYGLEFASESVSQLFAKGRRDVQVHMQCK